MKNKFNLILCIQAYTAYILRNCFTQILLRNLKCEYQAISIMCSRTRSKVGLISFYPRRHFLTRATSIILKYIVSVAAAKLRHLNCLWDYICLGLRVCTYFRSWYHVWRKCPEGLKLFYTCLAHSLLIRSNSLTYSNHLHLPRFRFF